MGVRAAIVTAVFVLSVPVVAPSPTGASVSPPAKASPQTLYLAAMADLRGSSGLHADVFGDGSLDTPDAPIIDVEYTDDLQGLMIVDALGHIGTAGSVPFFADADVTSGVVDATLSSTGQGYYILTVDGHVAVDSDGAFRGDAGTALQRDGGGVDRRSR